MFVLSVVLCWRLCFDYVLMLFVVIDRVFLSCWLLLLLFFFFVCVCFFCVWLFVCCGLCFSRVLLACILYVFVMADRGCVLLFVGVVACLFVCFVVCFSVCVCHAVVVVRLQSYYCVFCFFVIAVCRMCLLMFSVCLFVCVFVIV